MRRLADGVFGAQPLTPFFFKLEGDGPLGKSGVGFQPINQVIDIFFIDRVFG
jgi:hypothetical protein